MVGNFVKNLIDPDFRKANEVIRAYWGSVGWWLRYPIFRIPISAISDKEIQLESSISIPCHYILTEEQNNIYKKDDKNQEIQQWSRIRIKKQNETTHIRKIWWDSVNMSLYELSYNWKVIFLDKEGLENIIKKVLWIVWFFWLEEEKNKS
jgi:hypothetical protein